MDTKGIDKSSILCYTGIRRIKMIKVCEFCNKQFTSSDRRLKFCSRQCYGLSKIKSKTLKMCLECGSETYNPIFCSRTCAAKYNNAKNPKRKKRVWHCEKCGQIKERPYYGAHTCNECKDRPRELKHESIKSLRKMYETRKNQHQNVYSYIREQSRKIYLRINPSICVACGYNKHVEVCHIKQVSEYPDDALISEINSLDNLVALCPNCHWEFDHGLLKL